MTEQASGEYILIITMAVFIAITAVVAIIMTSLYAAKKGANDRMTDEQKFLDILAGSKSCECPKKP